MKRWSGRTAALMMLVVMSQGTVQAQVGTEVADASVTPAKESVLSRLVSIRITSKSLAEAIDALSVRAGAQIIYRSDVLGKYTAPVSVAVEKVPLRSVLEQLLAGTTLRVVPAAMGRIMIAEDHGRVQASAASGIIAGKVTDAASKQPLVKATVSLDGATRGVETTADGAFRFANVVTGQHTVRVRFLGYVRAAKAVEVADEQTTTADFALERSTNQLDQVVVTGTVIPTERRAVPNAMTVITAKQIEERGITHIDQLFHGDVPGVFAQNQGNAGVQPGEVKMSARGATGFNGPFAQPIKTYVDGIELANSSYLGLIDPKSIERIEILTGPQASTIYGSNAINGVMQIFTKRGKGSPRPQLLANLQSGLIQNNFSSAMTPQHDYSAQVSGTEGRISYNVGGSWNYMGPWTSAVRTATSNGFGGVRLQAGGVSTDVSLRRTIGTNWVGGSGGTEFARIAETGEFGPSGQAGRAVPNTYTSTAQTVGVILTYAPVPWWSQTFTVGSDATASERRQTEDTYQSPGDTLASLGQSRWNRASLAYTTTVRVPVTALATAVVTAGTDGWQGLSTGMNVRGNALTGSLSSPSRVTGNRQPSHNRGAFVQGQLGVWDALFLTYGLRAEWNPTFGDEVNPNVVPRYGIAITREGNTLMGPLTVKLRGSYGSATRPPGVDSKKEVLRGPDYFEDFGPGILYFANPDLVPEKQQGGEGGVEVYFGTRGSLVVTRYNQTVDNLIRLEVVDSVQRLDKNPDPYGLCGSDPLNCGLGAYTELYKMLNVGSIRNQGWEVQGSLTIGPFTGSGTYSFTKSRVIGITPKFRARDGGIKAGAAFWGAPEHTYALGVQYARGGSSASINVHGQGQFLMETSLGSAGFCADLFKGSLRLKVNEGSNVSVPPGICGIGPSYATGDLNIAQRLSAHLEGVLNIQNLTNRYSNDTGFGGAVIGRQSRAGLRLRW